MQIAQHSVSEVVPSVYTLARELRYSPIIGSYAPMLDVALLRRG